jgi:hypothetical protein
MAVPTYLGFHSHFVLLRLHSGHSPHKQGLIMLEQAQKFRAARTLLHHFAILLVLPFFGDGYY